MQRQHWSPRHVHRRCRRARCANADHRRSKCRWRPDGDVDGYDRRGIGGWSRCRERTSHASRGSSRREGDRGPPREEPFRRSPSDARICDGKRNAENRQAAADGWHRLFHWQDVHVPRYGTGHAFTGHEGRFQSHGADRDIYRRNRCLSRCCGR